MTDTIAIVTNVLHYAGQPAATALAADGHQVLCHDASFDAPAARELYESGHPGCFAAAAQAPEEVVAEALGRWGRLDVVVSNDAHPAARVRIEEAAAADYRATLEALMVAPFRLCGAAARIMKEQRAGRIILITSASPLRPYPGFTMYASARAGAGGLAQALSKELAAFGIQVNAVAPNFLASEAYYPRAQWVEDPKYVQRLKDMVPMQRLGDPAEIGALIAFLASGKSTFVTGQVIAFTGGWP